MAQSCSNCKHGFLMQETVLICRRYPPTVLMTPIPQKLIQPGGMPVQPAGNVCPVAPNWLCGEWEMQLPGSDQKLVQTS